MQKNWPLVILIAMFLAPPIIAGIILQNNTLIAPRKQHGHFIQPPFRLQINKANYISSTPDKKWSILYVLTNQSEDHNQITMLKQLHKALGSDTERVAIATISKSSLNTDIKDGSILIINPQGLYIMRYPQHTNFSGILKDIRRLLKYSHV